MSESTNPRLSAPVRLLLRLVLTIGLVWLLNTFFDQYFFVSGGLAAFIIIGSLLTLMNVLVRPLLHLILLPFKLFMGLLVTIAVNAGFLWLTLRIAERMDPDIVQLSLHGGVFGWVLIALLLGGANWVMKAVLR